MRLKAIERFDDMVVDLLDERDWDVSEESLEEIARQMEEYFPSYDLALEFVEIHASALVEMMEDMAIGDAAKRSGLEKHIYD